MKRLLTLAVGAVLAGVSITALALPAFSDSWSQSTLTGTIAPGVPWAANAHDTNSWGVPGVGNAITGWPDDDGYRDFHITFDLPTGVQLATGLGTTCVGGETGGTVLCSDPYTSPWEAVFDGPNSISFYAPAGVSLDNGVGFFVNIFFTGEVPSATFSGEWTTTGRVPEPATLALLGLGLAAVGLSRRRTAAGR
ncbi:MAG: PEP-CTERM sorting domain-containing protein [Rubrivivax sp.]|nr:PEP-CTERM sorting domain-containing protein [Rubrivivax sp.]